MNAFRFLVPLLLTLATSFAADSPPSAVVSNRQEGSFLVTASVRTNGCKLELWRYTKDKPHLQGYWIQHVYVGEKHLIQVQQHSATEKEQSLVIEHDKDCGVLQIDRNLDGKYEMLVVASLKDRSLVDVLFVTEDGWLRHSTPEEFQERQRVGELNKKALEELDQTIRGAAQKALDDLSK